MRRTPGLPSLLGLLLATLPLGPVAPHGVEARQLGGDVRPTAPALRVMPPDGASFAAGQRFDLRIEASAATPGGAPPGGLQVTLDGVDITGRNTLAGIVGLRDGAPGSTNLLVRGLSFEDAGSHTVVARLADGTEARATYVSEAWLAADPRSRRVKNVIFLLGDGMGLSHRTAARLVSRGLKNGKVQGRLAIDTMEVTGVVMTPSLNSAITDSAPGMSSYATGHKGANNQVGVYPDNTADAFDNPRVEYLGELLRRTRGPGFNVGIVTTADVTDATPAGNAAHTSDRSAGDGIAVQLFEERQTNAVKVLMGGGRRHFVPNGAAARSDGRDLVHDFEEAGYRYVTDGAGVRQLLAAPTAPPALLGLFHPVHMAVAFDKVGAGAYSAELALPKNQGLGDQPMLDDMARLAIRTLASASPDGFYLLIEGASIDKQAHSVDGERLVWDVIEFDHAVQVALDFAKGTNEDDDPTNDTLVVVTADHESGGFAIIGVGNERYQPEAIGAAVRDYAAVFRFLPDQRLQLVPNYQVDAHGFPVEPDPSRKLLFGWAAAPDHNENWVSNRVAQDGAVLGVRGPSEARAAAIANPLRDGADAASDNKTVSGKAIPGFLVPGTIENGSQACAPADLCQGDIPSTPQAIAGHTASDVGLAASGPTALQFTGTYENTDVFLKLLKAMGGTQNSDGRR